MATSTNKNHFMYAFFTKSDFIKELYIEHDTKFTLEPIYNVPDRLSLVMTLQRLPKQRWIVCEIIRTLEDGNIVVQVGLTNNEIQGLDTEQFVIDNETNRKIVHESLTNLLSLKSIFIRNDSSPRVIGIAYIPIEIITAKLIEKPLSMVISTNLSRTMFTTLPRNTTDMMRQVSKDVKTTVNLAKKDTVVNVGLDFNYGSEDELRKIWTSRDRQPEECTIELYLVMESHKNKLSFTHEIDALIKSNLNINAKFFISPNLPHTTEEIYNFLCATIQKLPNIVLLEIDFKGRSTLLSDDSFVRETYDVWSILSGLKGLYSLHMMNVHNLSWKPFFHCLEKMPNLTELLFTRIVFVSSPSPQEQVTFVDAFATILRNSKITKVGVRDSCLIDKEYAVDEIALALDGITQVTYFDISDNDTYAEPTFFRDIFTPRMIRLGHLKTLDISYNELGNEGLRDLLPILRSLPNLEILNLSDTSITLTPLIQEELIEVFQGIRNLKTFYISGNTLNEQAIAVLLPILRSLPNLEELNLSHTQLNIDLLINKGLLDTIQQSLKKLRKLIIKQNKISKDDIYLIRNILPKVEIISN
jgi:hypothetical protein